MHSSVFNDVKTRVSQDRVEVFRSRLRVTRGWKCYFRPFFLVAFFLVALFFLRLAISVTSFLFAKSRVTQNFVNKKVWSLVISFFGAPRSNT
ncbi:hypothetical protein RAS2_12710 [Phycisphaerae bacterium RAS2]|jgi:hypothetical protein|nr:hypothetical protein RAS2_12710 [Phycisphaerae bacterium RAS2]